jgi:PAS domain S-box-containing protein
MIKLINVNKTALATYGARNVAELKEHFRRFPSPDSAKTLARTLSLLSQGEKKFETQFTTTDLLGNELHIYLKVSVAPGDGERFSRVFISLLDITQLKEAEEALRHSEQKYRNLVENVTADVCLLDFEGRFLFANESLARTFGKSAEEIVGKTLSDIMPGQDNESKLANIRRVMESGKEFREETRVYIRSQPKWVSVNIQPYHDSAGDPAGALIISYDITDRKLAEDQVIASQERLRAIINSIDDLIFVINREGKFTFFEQAGKDHSLYAGPGDFVGRHLSEVMPEEVSHSFNEHFRQIESDGIARQMDYSLKIGDEIRWYSAKLSPLYGPDGKFDGVTAVAREITSQVRDGIDLKNERDFNRSILETANSLILCLDTDARIKIFNDECERVTGYKREEVLGKSWPEIFLPESYRHSGLTDFESWVKNHPRDNYEGPIITKSGEERTILWSNSVIIDPITRDVTAIAIGQDITLKKRVEEAHRKSEKRLRTQFKSFPIPSYTWKKEGDDFILADFNDAAFKITNGKISSVRGIKLSKLYAKYQELIRDISTCYQQRTNNLREMDYIYQTTGKKKSLIVNYAYVPPDLVMVFTQDITDLKRAREEKIRQAKDIAGGFAHEIRNALFPAKGAISLLYEGRNGNHVLQKNFSKYLHMTDDSLKKAIDITNQISQYTRMESEYCPEKVLLTSVVRKVLDANQLQIEEKGIKVICSGPEEIAIQSNSKQFYQVLNNLLLNSIDALTKVEKPAIFLTWKQIDSDIYLEFTDNGEGIAKTDLSRVFDAFFSTKPNNGTGIGLAMARKAVEMYEGNISVSSELKKGTTFSIKLKHAE